jgi:hypothetical protein
VYTIVNTATIISYEDSTAENYAEKYNRTFVPLNGNVLLGDPNMDDDVSVEDAVIALTMYAQASAGLELDFTESQITAADVNGDGVVTVEDAVYILTYYAKQAAGLEVSWEELIA